MKRVCRGIEWCEEKKIISVENPWLYCGCLGNVSGYKIDPDFGGSKKTIYKLLKKAILFAKGKNVMIIAEHHLITEEELDELYSLYELPYHNN